MVGLRYLALPSHLHNLPRNPKKLLPKFDPETSGSPEDHIKFFILAIRLMNVQHTTRIPSSSIGF
jgi:hypothetical protein